MELCVYGSLRSILLDKDNTFETPELIRFASETATGVAYLHATDVSIIHGDLKADNVLVREDGSVCLCDFGLLFLFLDEEEDIWDDAAVFFYLCLSFHLSLSSSSFFFARRRRSTMRTSRLDRFPPPPPRSFTSSESSSESF